MENVIRPYTIKAHEKEVQTMVTAISNGYDTNGNKMYLVQVWAIHPDRPNGNLWYPHIKGYRDRQDSAYKMQSDNIGDTMDYFMNEFQKKVNS